MPETRPLLSGVRGRTAAIALAIIALSLLARAIRTTFSASEIATASANRIFICAETGRSFHHTLKLGETLPISSPYSGKPTGHPAELCNWTADGKVSEMFTPVLLNSLKGLPEPTFCPACDRMVVALNPPADGARRPPLTQREYRSRLAQLARREGE